MRIVALRRQTHAFIKMHLRSHQRLGVLSLQLAKDISQHAYPLTNQYSLTDSTGTPPSRNAVLILFRSNWSVEVPLPEEVNVGARKSPVLLNLATTKAPSEDPLPPPLRSRTPPPSTSTKPSNVWLPFMERVPVTTKSPLPAELGRETSPSTNVKSPSVVPVPNSDGAASPAAVLK